jgi:sulfite reductase (NADPH) hemoprotein beta-component
MSNQKDNLSAVEIIKEKSNYLRGTLKKSLLDETTGSIYADDQQLIKLHGTYLQSDRELDSERKKQKLEPLYSFMIRVRLPAGVITANQWLAIDQLSDKYGSKTIKLTTRQAVELHSIFKKNLKTTIKEINNNLMDTIAACGDVNRNVMASANPSLSKIHGEIHSITSEISRYFTPKTSAYHEIWLDKELVAGGVQDEEPIYGKTYLPRKFKIAIAIPPVNDTDIFANDIGLIAIVEKGELIGFNVAIGGGMGMTFGETKTYPRLASIIGYIGKQKIIDVIEKIILIQRDNGNRSNRKIARLKYTIDRLGLQNFITELHSRLGYELETEKEYVFKRNGDEFGWKKGVDGKWHYTLFIEGGRVKDSESLTSKSALKEIAIKYKLNYILTGNQNLVITNVDEKYKDDVEKILKANGLQNETKTGLRLNSIACVALNLCPLAFSEAERYLPQLIDKIDKIMIENGLEKDEITIRMTGCPNGCGRPYLGEIGFVGRAPGRYNMYLGAGFSGDRLNYLYKEMLNEEQIILELSKIIPAYAKKRNTNEHFGDFVIRNGYVKVVKEAENYQI